jgi:hypothetical protein
MESFADIDMENISMKVVEYTETTNRRGGRQISTSVPTSMAKLSHKIEPTDRQSENIK